MYSYSADICKNVSELNTYYNIGKIHSGKRSNLQNNYKWNIFTYIYLL